MINLLPPHEKAQLIFEKNKKLIIVSGSVVIISLLSLMLLLSLVKIFILQELETQKVVLQAHESSFQVASGSPVRVAIQKYNTVFLRLNNFYKEEVSFGDVLRVIAKIQKPSGVHIATIALESGQKQQAVEVKVSGIADTREDLTVFRDTLEALSSLTAGEANTITDIYFPPESWVDPVEVAFNISFVVNETPK